ncbi:hypothetical protein [Methylobacterium nonmethylotrophicum]|uniref:Uncharacterized protein n=1 Tax=Methylobacterium nonmethylotrophicum TaxID=1141884 RepID=A0A4Z0NTF9_9HYPH|nr:hypothetical protein [Methylobacterium nonmethylotrophicum]TGE00174.1 hypothetical protein EU555_09680 [Methylobacterium nonmethylotrophicum]
MASPLPLVCRSDGPEPLTLGGGALRRPASRLPIAMLVRGLAVIAGLGMPVAAATLADLAHPASPSTATR